MDQLPDRIPIHYDSSGKPDGFSNKSMIWTLPVIGGVLVVIMASLGYYLPNQRHDPKKHSKEVHDQQMIWSIHLVGILNVIMTSTFAYIVYRTVEVALGNAAGLGSAFLPVFLGLIFAPIIFICWKMYRADK